MVVNVVVPQAAVWRIEFWIVMRHLVRWRQRSSCARVRDRARAWARHRLCTEPQPQKYRGTEAHRHKDRFALAD